jgi:hypothetical protein
LLKYAGQSIFVRFQKSREKDYGIRKAYQHTSIGNDGVPDGLSLNQAHA